MDAKNFRILRCIYCKQGLEVLRKINKDTFVLGCKCQSYPLIKGILYLKRGKRKDKAVSYLVSGKERLAVYSLIDLKRRLLYPAYLLLLPSVLNRASKLFFDKNLYEILGFKKIIRILTFFSYPRLWSSYLMERFSMPTFYMGLLTSHLIKKGDLVLDFGCGVGHLLPILSKRTFPSNVIAADKSFLNLVLARKFVANDNLLLICCDAEEGLPLKDNTLDTTISVDSYHNLVRKKFFLKEAYRLLKNSGFLAVVHCLNSEKKVYENIFGKRFDKTLVELKSAGFKKIRIYSNNSLWSIVQRKADLDLMKSDTPETLKTCTSYSFFASKNRLPRSIKLDRKENQLLKKRGVNYGWDEYLLNKGKLDDLLNKYDNFAFLSPHLDDGVLSCGMLLTKLQKLKKRLVVITVFTKAGPKPYSPQAQKFLEVCGYEDAQKLFKDRKKEDIRAIRFFGAKHYHLGFVDAAWRKDKGERNIYKNEKMQFSGKIAKQDIRLVDKIARKISSFVPIGKKTIIFAPLGVGGHADHVIIREVAHKLNAVRTLYWEDFPYNSNKDNVNKFFFKNKNFLLYLDIEGTYEQKARVIKFYKSQISGLFSEKNIPRIPERYFFRDNLSDL